MRSGVLVRAKTCFDHARDACGALECATGCDIHDGEPKLVFCALGGSKADSMTRCAGYSGLVCPEDMRCEIPAGSVHVYDAAGTCVPMAGRHP